MIKCAVLTVSDSRTEENDLSGKKILNMLNNSVFEICNYGVVKDDRESIVSRLIHDADIKGVDLILTSGGTGLGVRDVTPEATLEVIEKQVPGFGELMRMEGYKKTDRSFLSRGLAGIRKATLIINLPGSPRGVEEMLGIILKIIPHAIDMLKGKGH